MGSRAERWIVYCTDNGMVRRIGTVVARTSDSALRQARDRFRRDDIFVRSLEHVRREHRG